MVKIIICLALTLVFTVMSYSSFMSNDYGPLQSWMAYYTEYKALQGAKDKGEAGKAELMAKLKKLYPERAKKWEQSARDKFSEAQDTAESASDSISDKIHSYETDEAEPSRAAEPARTQNSSGPAQKSQSSGTSNSSAKNQPSRSDTAKTNSQNNKAQ